MKIAFIQRLIDKIRRHDKKYKRGRHTFIAPGTFVDKYCEIGDYTSIGRDVDITRATIGRYCSIASHVRIGPGEHDLNEISTSVLLSYRGRVP